MFNLSVEGTPEFFANGVLVHNCDAAFWSWRDLRKGGRATMTVPQGSIPKPPISTRGASAGGGRMWVPGR